MATCRIAIRNSYGFLETPLAANMFGNTHPNMKDHPMAKSSTRGTGNEPAGAIDPGGTRPAKAGKSATTKTPQNVASGDRNKSPTKPETRIKK